MKYRDLLFIGFLMCTPSLLSQTISNKRGVGYDLANSLDAKALASGLSWFYNWGVQPNAYISGLYDSYGLDYLPMTWGATFNETALRSFLTNHPKVKYLLAFNEPNFKSQANLTPSQVVALWPKLEQIAKDFNLKLVGPAVNYSGDNVTENGKNYNDPVTFYDDLFALNPNAKMDYIAIHYYMADVSQLEYHLARLYKYGKKIWLTEFNMDNGTDETTDQQKNFAVAAIHSLENNPNIFRYAWFLGRADGYPSISLLSTTYGYLSSLGYIYTKMSSYDANFYHKANTDIPAEQYVNMSGVSLCNLSTDISDVYIGYIDAGDWLDYNIDTPSEGSYTFSVKMASTQASSINIILEDGTTKTIPVTNSGGWESWKWFSAQLNLKQGHNRIRIVANTSNVNIDLIRVSSLTSGIESSNADKPYSIIRENNSIRIESNKPLSTSVYSLNGQEILHQTGTSILLNKMMNSGLAILKIIVDDKTYIEKLF